MPQEYILPIDLNTPYANYLEYAEDPETPRNILLRLAKHTYPKIRAAVASNQRISRRAFEILAEDKEVKVLKALANNPAAPDDILYNLAKHENDDVRVALAGNTSLPERAIDVLSNSQGIEVDKNLAANPNTPPHLLREFFFRIYPDDRFDSWPIEACLASNPNTPLDILRQIALYSSTNTVAENEVLTALAKNPSTPASILNFLVGVSTQRAYYKELQLAIINNPKTIKESLYKFTVVTDLKVQEALEKRLGSDFEDIKEKFDTATKYKDIAKNSDTDPGTLSAIYFSNKDNFELNFHLASNPNTPEEVLLDLISRDIQVHKIVSNQGITDKVIDALLDYPGSKNILPKLLQNPSLPSKYISEIYKINNSFSYTDAAIENLIASSEKTPDPILIELAIKASNLSGTGLAGFLLRRETLPPKAFEYLSKIKSEYIRNSILEHPKAPLSLKKKLIKPLLKDRDSFIKSKPHLNFKGKLESPAKSKTNSDLELLKRLKGLIS